MSATQNELAILLRRMRQALLDAESAWTKAMKRKEQVYDQVDQEFRPGSGRMSFSDMRTIRERNQITDWIYQAHVGDHEFFLRRAQTYALVALAEIFASEE